ncbi:MAG: adenosylcobalamin-dependent ribonucleoside-diphosphate reductase [Candidatus Aenigmatarchaeota archaeon]
MNNFPLKPKWRFAKDLEEGDFVLTVFDNRIIDKNEVKISDLIPKELYTMVNNRSLRDKNRPNKGKLIPDKINIDEDFMRLVGYWLAEGSLSDRYKGKPSVVRFTFSSKESKYAYDVIKIMKEKFNLSARKEVNENQHTIQLRFHSNIVASFFECLFRRGFEKKDLPEWMMTLPKEKQFQLLIGIFRGDGCYYQGTKQDIIFLQITNEQLAYKIWSILGRLGFYFNILKIHQKLGKDAYRISSSPSECEELVKNAFENRRFRKRKSFPQYIKYKNLILRPIKKIQKVFYDGVVYNLEVLDDHSFVANGISVHNCYVLPVGDSLESIFNALKNMSLIEQSGGGVGFDFSKLRPKGDIVRSTHGVASGPVSFMRIFDVATDVIKQGGRRRGAMMGILRIDHPDILEFINAKSKEGFLTNFNLSVAITDEFMKALKENKEYDLINPRNQNIVKRIKARYVWNLIVENAWKTGDPGLIFIDEINRHNPTPFVGKIEATNPCGEFLGLPYESCNLGSIAIQRMVNDKGEIDWEKLRRVIHIAVHFLDNVIDANYYTLPEIEKITKANRKIGLGIMGWAEFLIKLNIPYDSKEALSLAEKIMKFVSEEARKKSEELGLKRGSFPNFEKSIFYGKYKAMRNATVTAIAPTGSISIIAGCSSGIEPLFAISFMRNVLEGNKLFEVNPLFEKISKENGFYSAKLLEKIAKLGSIQKIKEIPKEIRRIFVTALDIEPEWHVKMQAAFQKYVDNAVSKTVNLPNNATKKDVEKAFLLAYSLKCKGITVYRYGSKKQQVLNIGKPHLTVEAEYAGGCPTLCHL